MNQEPTKLKTAMPFNIPAREGGRLRLALRIALALGLISVVGIGVFYYLQAAKRVREDGLLAREASRVKSRRAEERAAAARELTARHLPSKTPSQAFWTEFRNSYPFHCQTVALSEPSSDASRTLIVSEPPPNVSLEDILLAVGGLLLNHNVSKVDIGHDGWAKDVVVSLKGNPIEVGSVVSSLNRLLFSTSYKSYYVALPVHRPTQINYDLDLKVTAGDLKHWILDEREPFVPIEGGAALTAQTLLAQSGSAVYLSYNPGFVGWWIPKAKTIQSCRVQARQFVLDSDLIVGAISNESGMLVLGRERVVPVELLPPLRIETLELLASVQGGQEGKLAQSYERMHKFAGRIEGENDWAPILLSPELVDTEYGSLLNITDQLLKSWSNKGRTSYLKFHYPNPPGGGPPFKQDLTSLLHTHQLTYNWNTTGVGYAVHVGNYSVFALNRTGALPVSYIPNGTNDSPSDAAGAEEQAYDYFSRVHDPNLVRVLQYAAMYQIFSAFDIAKGPKPYTNEFPATRLKDLTSELENELHYATAAQRLLLQRQLTPIVSKQLRLMQEDATESVQYALEHANEEKGRSVLSGAFDLGLVSHDEFSKRLVLSEFAALKKMPERYANDVEARAKGWIHTPVVVVSRNATRMDKIVVGGHNLDARITKFVLSDDVPIGRTLVKDGEILVNPAEAEKIGNVVRTAAAEKLPAALELRMNKAIAEVNTFVPHSRADALALPSSLREVQGARSIRPFGDTMGRQGGWETVPSKSSESALALDELKTTRQAIENAVIVERKTGGGFVINHSEAGGPLRVGTAEDATDAVVQLLRNSPRESRGLHLELRGFQEHEGASFVRSCEIRAADENIPREIAGLLKDEGLADQAIADLRLKRYDFSRAEIKITDTELSPTGELKSGVEVEIPVADGPSSTGRVRIELKFAKETPGEVVRIVMQRVRDAIRHLVSEMRNQYDALLFNYKLNLEIKRIAEETQVDVELIQHLFNDGSKDLYFAEKGEVDGIEAPDPHGSRAA